MTVMVVTYRVKEDYVADAEAGIGEPPVPGPAQVVGSYGSFA